MTSRTIDPGVVRGLVRRELEARLGGAGRAAAATHPSELPIASGPECSEDLDLPMKKPCLIEPHRLCYNSGYCKKLGF